MSTRYALASQNSIAENDSDFAAVDLS